MPHDLYDEPDHSGMCAFFGENDEMNEIPTKTAIMRKFRNEIPQKKKMIVNGNESERTIPREGFWRIKMGNGRYQEIPMTCEFETLTCQFCGKTYLVAEEPTPNNFSYFPWIRNTSKNDCTYQRPRMYSYSNQHIQSINCKTWNVAINCGICRNPHLTRRLKILRGIYDQNEATYRFDNFLSNLIQQDVEGIDNIKSEIKNLLLNYNLFARFEHNLTGFGLEPELDAVQQIQHNSQKNLIPGTQLVW